MLKLRNGCVLQFIEEFQYLKHYQSTPLALYGTASILDITYHSVVEQY